jgi:heterotetrameric sarcosine oxidase gamma subunit
MLELEHRSGLQSLIGEVVRDGLAVAEPSGYAIANIIARKGKLPDLADSFRTHLGIELPQGPRRAHRNGLAVLGIGPGKWLAIDESPAFAGMRDLASAVDGTASLIEQSAAFAMLRVSGPAAGKVLQKGVHLDLHPDVFGVDHVAVTRLGQIGATLWKIDTIPTFQIAFPRSMAASLCHWLGASSRHLSNST